MYFEYFVSKVICNLPFHAIQLLTEEFVFVILCQLHHGGFRLS